MVRALSQFSAKTFNILGMKSTPCPLQNLWVHFKNPKQYECHDFGIIFFIHSFRPVICSCSNQSSMILPAHPDPSPVHFLINQSSSMTSLPDCLCAICLSFPASNCFLTCFFDPDPVFGFRLSLALSELVCLGILFLCTFSLKRIVAFRVLHSGSTVF